MGKNEEKTNVMRILEQKKISYIPHLYYETGETNGMEIARVLGENPERCYKTLVTVGKSGKNFCFVIPVCRELNLKKAAKSVGEKSIEMLKSKDLLPLTGYVHGGCSPIGMKKPFETVFQTGIFEFETIYFSAGKIGYQVEIAPDDISSVIRFKTDDVVE